MRWRVASKGGYVSTIYVFDSLAQAAWWCERANEIQSNREEWHAIPEALPCEDESVAA